MYSSFGTSLMLLLPLIYLMLQADQAYVWVSDVYNYFKGQVFSTKFSQFYWC